MASTPVETEPSQPGRRYFAYGLLAFGVTSAVLPVAYILSKRPAGIKIPLMKHTNGPPPPRRATTLLAPASSKVVSAPLASNQPKPNVSYKEDGTEERTGLASFLPEDVQMPTQEEIAMNGFSTLKAFLIATAAMTALSGVTVYGVTRWMGVNTVDEFSTRMKQLIARKLPDIDAPPQYLPAITTKSSTKNESSEDSTTWTWNEAQDRLKVAYERDGLSGWFSTAVQEMEAERRIERRKVPVQ